MGYKVSFEQMNDIFNALSTEYDIYAPKRFVNQGRYSETDIIRYDQIHNVEDIVFHEKSDYPAKEVLSPITQSLFYFTEDEYRESKVTDKKILIFMRPCDVNAMEHQNRIYLQNGGYEDLYYKRLEEKVKIVLMECTEGWDTCFCVSMNANITDHYSLAVRCLENELLVEIKDQDFVDYFENQETDDFKVQFIEKNQIEVEIPEIKNKEVLAKLKAHPMWQTFNKRCISCGACTIACSTCTCFTTTDIIYNENAHIGERKRTSASCQVDGFSDMAGGHSFRPTAGDRMRYKILHKFHDYKARFKDYHMCVGCGRCTSRCPEYISVTATVGKMAKAIAEIESEGE
ncbi:anaerobic sulfite reductase subunit AsrA [Candidatus Stoquefichus sp. SB1]|uniref:anaerobic sulfite reductase subunit AsrA n=1 Tax=Candidatus Stoquefichus sp. SB1 TaxID=1658109 RepID=UPI00067E7693|nr:anaerobic sulfite reductase subunit AsrA [Candidatus Stoquefichus sp. SB1]